MSGLLRRIKRSRPADAGEPLPEGQAAEPQGAPPRRDAAAAAVTRTHRPPARRRGGADSRRRRRARGRAKPARERRPAPGPAGAGPPPPPDPAAGTAAGPARGPERAGRHRPGRGADAPPAGRRGRLRRRLRYLRRARELMLRDLGGLLYEIHRTGGGDVDAHANVVGAKVQRIAGLDAEAHALEAALAAPRAEAVVFEPGVGGTCAVCGELYGSDARFCSNCGTPIGAAPPGPGRRHPGQHVAAEPARRRVLRRAARPRQPSRGEPRRAADDAVAREPASGDGGGARGRRRAPAARPADRARRPPRPTRGRRTRPAEPAAATPPSRPRATTAARAAEPRRRRRRHPPRSRADPRREDATTTPRQSPCGGRNGRPEERHRPGSRPATRSSAGRRARERRPDPAARSSRSRPAASARAAARR